MSLFSRLEERMRARDNQEESKDKNTEKEKTDSPEEGGLFGAIQLGPRDESNVPPPNDAKFVVRREVPSLEEARAEFDRARADMASSVFRDSSSSDEEDALRAPETGSRESVGFGAVTLPPAESDSSRESIFAAQTTAPDASDKTDVAPEKGAFAPAEPSAPEPVASNAIIAETTDEIDLSSSLETPIDETENLSISAESDSDQTSVASIETPKSIAEIGGTVAPVAPTARFGNNSELTPFQRLMAARAAQGGSTISRSRTERPVVEPPIAEAPVAEAPIAEAPVAEAPVAEAPVVESPVVEASVGESSVAEETSGESPVTEDEMNSSAAVEMAPIELPLAQIEETSDDAAMMSESESEPAEPEEFEALAPEDGEVEAFVESTSPIELEETQAPVDDESPIETSLTPDESTAQNEVETEIAPQIENVESPVAPSLAEQLANAPRAELEAAHAEAEELTPEVLSETKPTPESPVLESPVLESPVLESPVLESPVLESPVLESPVLESPVLESPVLESPVLESPVLESPVVDTRTAAAISFAERLAARKRLDNSSVETSRRVTALPAETEVVEKTTDFVPPVAPSQPEEAPRSGPRSFSERLAARTGLDRNLQLPVEAPPTSQSLANANAELVRIDEGVQLSEPEMKNRVLFRQKHLMFDSVIGAVDARALQNPTRESVKPQIERGVDAAIREFNLGIEGADRNWMIEEFVRELTDLGALVPMLEDPTISKIVVTGANDVSVERLGRIERTGVSFRNDEHLLSLVRRIAEMSGGRVDAKVPLLDRPLPDGGRIRAKVPPLAPQPTLTIEKSTGNPFVALKRQNDERTRGEALPYAQLRERIQQRLLREFEGDAAALAGDQDKLRGQVEEMIGSVIAEEHVAVTRAERASLVMDLLHEIVGLGPIEPLLNDPDVDEVMVNGPYQIYVERKGKLELTSQRFRDNAHVMQVIDRIVAPLGRRVDEKSPMVDGRLRDGSRFNAIIPPLALSGPTMTIRKFARDPFTMSDLINFGSLTREAAQFLQAAVEGRLNIVVSGGTGSGKTTTLNVLSSFIPSTERIVTIEDAAELQMRQEHVIRMETRPPNIEGVGEVGIRDLVRNSLRMRPDRIVVGECRGGEALDMLQAMNTGHDGSLTTAHSNGPRDTCKRLETMVMMAGFDLPVRAIREQISMGVQLIVHQERMRDGKRRVTAITEIVGMEGDVLTMQDIFRFVQEGIDEEGRVLGALQATGMRPKYYETIVDNGAQISMELFAPKPHEAAPRARMNER